MKVTEKQLKARVTELNLGVLKETTFGIKVDRESKGYSCSLVYIQRMRIVLYYQ